MQKPLFGVAGFPVNFFDSSYGKKRENIFKWLNEIGLNVIELQCTYGIRMKEEQALLYRKLAKENDILLTVHAPYYINLGSLNPQVVENSKNEIKKAFALAELLDAKRIIFHPGGGYGKTKEDRIQGIERLIHSLQDIKSDINSSVIKLYPEIGGKISALGSLEEIIQICKQVDYAYPCIDLAHLHARQIGGMSNSSNIVHSLNIIEQELGRDILEKTHFHVYPVDYTEKGEKVHKAFGDKIENIEEIHLKGEEYLPRASDYITAIKEKKLAPITICEAHNTQDVGAMLMRDIYNNKKGV